MIPGAEIFHAASAAPGIHAYRQQGQSNGNYHTGRNYRCQKPLPVLGAQSYQTLENTAQNHGSHHPLVAKIGIRTDHQKASQKGKADAHNDRQPGADLPDRIKLHTGTDACRKHGALQKLGDLR